MVDINILNGKEIFIEEFSLSNKGNSLELLLIIKFLDKKYCAYLYDVSGVSLDDLSFPMQICGFDFISNQKKGWDWSSSYEICDFEDDKIHLYCKDFDFFELETSDI
ncbi:MAG: hypothetical protein K2F65_00980 [Eubacterium sp.]|nr:hypothetical protein [Eubacterium sp.]